MKKTLTLATLLTLLVTASNAQHPVVWDALQSVIVTGDAVEKIDGSFWGGTALSRNLLPASSNGYVEVTVSGTHKTRMIGFTSANTLVDYQNLDYAIATAASLNIKVFQNGEEIGIFGTYQDGDKFALEKNGNTILYKRNGQTFHTAPITNPKNLKIGVDLYHDNSRWVNITTSFKAVDVNQMWDFISGNTLHDDIFRYGRVAIGTESLPAIPDDYKLSVEGRIIAEGVKVQLKNTWPDYVFEEDYVLLPLSELKKFIDENKHLPGIPPASEMEKEGLDVERVNIQLLKKIEELTLYQIQLMNKLEEQANQIEALNDRINRL